jgi:alginate O-acetyltransferase complex protein AlgI
MPFSSFNFILSLPLFVMTFWLLPKGMQKYWLILLSFIVYMAAGLPDFFLLFLAVFANWAIPFYSNEKHFTTAAMVVADLGMLAWFKYRFFLSGIVGIHSGYMLLIPLGISFYIFQMISYQVEIRRGQVTGKGSFWEFFLYIFFFPHHQAGPIMRPHAFLICFHQARTFFRSRLLTGLLIFLWGLFKKVWIADLIAPKVDEAYLTFQQSGGGKGSLVFMAIMYGIQIYGDFSGYSDMAVGMGRLFGYKFDRNFHQPYIARGASEFWRRWHVTLSLWLRDFVYIPLGGNRGSYSRTLANLFLVMLVGGLWHGAGWNFVIWGGMHGVYLIVERLTPDYQRVWIRWPKYILFQLLVMLTWLPFREPNISFIWHALSRPTAWFGADTDHALKYFAAILVFSQLENILERRFTGLVRTAGRIPAPTLAVVYGILLFLVLIGAGNATTFIYQRF